jgi:hypothetical protein
MVFYRLEIPDTTVSAIARHQTGLKPPSQHLGQHTQKIIIFGFTFGFIVNPEINRLMLPLRIGVIQRNQVNVLNRSVMLAGPEIVIVLSSNTCCTSGY